MPTSTRSARITLYAVLAFVILAGLGSAFAQWRAGDADRKAKAAQEKSDEVARCLTGYRLIYVDGPAERARSAEKKVLELVARGEVESPAYVRAVDGFASAKNETDVDAFADLNRRARLHPESFVRECRRDDP